MKCEEAKLLVGALQDDDLEPQLKIQIEKHLLICANCENAFEQTRELSRLLQKSFVPAPSAALDRNILQEFRLEREQQRRRTHKTSWRQYLLVGSITIPKPVFAAAAVVIIAAFGLFGLIGRNASNSSDVADVKTSATSSVTSSPHELNETDKTKIIEVPVFRERIIKQIVYVERRNPDNQTGISQYSILARNKSASRERLQKGFPAVKQNNLDIKVSDSIAENGYFTKTNLSAFQPVSEMKTRIIKEVKINEK